jgi:DNA-binding IclR family transcriptional regulator
VATVGGRGGRESVIERISLLIAAFDAESPTLSLGELTERSGLPKSTVHRIADQLLESHWLERAAVGYRLGMRFFEVGALVSGRTRLRERALPYLQDLQAETGQTVHLAILAGGEVLVLEKLQGHRSPEVATRVGGRLPAHCTAAGKALLAFAPDKVVDDIIAGGLQRHTGRTIVVPELFRQELVSVRTGQWAAQTEEWMPGVRCVAAPVRGSGRAIAAVSVGGPVQRVSPGRVVPLVRKCGTDIYAQLFGRRTEEGEWAAGEDDLSEWLEM